MPGVRKAAQSRDCKNRAPSIRARRAQTRREGWGLRHEGGRRVVVALVRPRLSRPPTRRHTWATRASGRARWVLFCEWSAGGLAGRAPGGNKDHTPLHPSTSTPSPHLSLSSHHARCPSHPPGPARPQPPPLSPPLHLLHPHPVHRHHPLHPLPAPHPPRAPTITATVLARQRGAHMHPRPGPGLPDRRADDPLVGRCG